MTLTAQPTRTDGSLGRTKADRPGSGTPDLNHEQPAAEWNRVVQAILDVCDEVGIDLLTIAAAGRVTLNQRVAALEAYPIVTETTTARTLTNDDNGCAILCTQTCAVTIPDTLGIGFQCMLIQKGAGKITCTAGAGVTMYYPASAGVKSAEQEATIGVLKYAAGHVQLSGALAA